jgi:hypothetical protein
MKTLSTPGGLGGVPAENPIQNERWYWVNHFEPEKADLSSRSIMQSMDVRFTERSKLETNGFKRASLTIG